MRPSTILSEAARNTTSGASHVVALSICFSISLFSLSSLEITAIAAAASAQTEFDRIGGSTYVVSAPDGIDGRVCEQINDYPGVLSAGAAASARNDVYATAFPDAPIPLLAVSPRFVQLLRLSSPPTGPAIFMQGGLVAEVKPGGVRMGDEPINNALSLEPFRLDDREGRLEYIATGVDPLRSIFDQCWVVTRDTNVSRIAALAIIPDYDPDAITEIQSINPTAGPPPASSRNFRSRPTRNVPYLAGATGALVGLISIRLRRTALASAQHFGTKKIDLLLQSQVETLIWVLAGTGVAYFATTAALWDSVTVIPRVSQLRFLNLASMMWIGAFLGASMTLLLTSPSQYYRYYRGRA